jgi:hydroxymethylpyrimidine/phosphomethylpyrimidine kinase
MQESVKNAKAYITGALKANLDLGQGSGPLDHCFCI